MNARLNEQIDFINGIAPITTSADTAINTDYVSAVECDEISAILTVGVMNAATTSIELGANSTDGIETDTIKNNAGDTQLSTLTLNENVEILKVANPATETNDDEVVINGIKLTKKAAYDEDENEFLTNAQFASIVSLRTGKEAEVVGDDVFIRSDDNDLTVDANTGAYTITTEKATRMFSFNVEKIKKGHDELRFTVTSADNVALVALTIMRNTQRTNDRNIVKNEF